MDLVPVLPLFCRAWILRQLLRVPLGFCFCRQSPGWSLGPALGPGLHFKIATSFHNFSSQEIFWLLGSFPNSTLAFLASLSPVQEQDRFVKSTAGLGSFLKALVILWQKMMLITSLLCDVCLAVTSPTPREKGACVNLLCALFSLRHRNGQKLAEQGLC